MLLSVSKRVFLIKNDNEDFGCLDYKMLRIFDIVSTLPTDGYYVFFKCQ